MSIEHASTAGDGEGCIAARYHARQRDDLSLPLRAPYWPSTRHRRVFGQCINSALFCGREGEERPAALTQLVGIIIEGAPPTDPA